ncbi:hypothetical protein KUCAC02_000999 [Chaenocephalus aceratus]|uniref:Uncharacterized protein n=1 Tax=Chaenocephalus aceratus TaxID=36190 RepID=A0ACB9XXB5_CHAAC|nr:hypothetical protein KUCAC02_000999 [Chaenocephalus aceratus]
MCHKIQSENVPSRDDQQQQRLCIMRATVDLKTRVYFRCTPPCRSSELLPANAADTQHKEVQSESKQLEDEVDRMLKRPC